MYPHQRHHEHDADYWNPERKSAGQEYRRVDDIKDDQNRSVTSWVKPGQEFRFHIDVRNLSDHELGALLWLLDPDRLGVDGHPGYHRFGAGKPFGFGSVRLDVIPELADLRRGEEWRADIVSLGVAPVRAEPGWNTLAAGFERAMSRAPHGMTILATVRRVAAGCADDQPVHYPRKAPRRTPEGENYQWFVHNEALKEPTSLPALGPACLEPLSYPDPINDAGAKRRTRGK